MKYLKYNNNYTKSKVRHTKINLTLALYFIC